MFSCIVILTPVLLVSFVTNENIAYAEPAKDTKGELTDSSWKQAELMYAILNNNDRCEIQGKIYPDELGKSILSDKSIVASPIVGSSDSKMNCQDGSRGDNNIISILYGSRTAFVEKYYLKATLGDGSVQYWMKGEFCTDTTSDSYSGNKPYCVSSVDQSKIKGEMRVRAITEGWYESKGSTMAQPLLKETYRHRNLHNLFLGNCYVAYDSFKNSESSKVTIQGLDLVKASGYGSTLSVGYVIEPDDGKWSCDELTDYVNTDAGAIVALTEQQLVWQRNQDAINNTNRDKVEKILPKLTSGSGEFELCTKDYRPFFNASAPAGTSEDAFIQFVAGIIAAKSTKLESGEESYVPSSDEDKFLTQAMYNCFLNEAVYGGELAALLDTQPITQEIPPESNPNDENASGSGDECDANLNSPLSWIICPIMDILYGTLNDFASVIKSNLNYDISLGLYPAWSEIRNIANILFIIAFLLIIISQTLGGKL